MNEGKIFTVRDLAKDAAMFLSLSAMIILVCVLAAANTPMHLPV